MIKIGDIFEYINIYFLKRIIKEKSMYEKEVTQTENRIEKMKTDGKDEYDIKKMVNQRLYNNYPFFFFGSKTNSKFCFYLE